MHCTWERVKKKGSVGQLGAQTTAQSRDEGPMAQKLKSFTLSCLVQSHSIELSLLSKPQQQWKAGKKKKKKKRKKANTKLPMETKRVRERESLLCEAKCFCNCVGDLVVWHINKFFDFSILLLLCTGKPQMCWDKNQNFFFLFYLMR